MKESSPDNELRSAAQVAKLLLALHEAEFGGKPAGRFSISERRLKKLAKRRRLRTAFEDELQDAALELGLVVSRLEEGFCVCAAYKQAAWRRVGRMAVDEIEASYAKGDDKYLEEVARNFMRRRHVDNAGRDAAAD